MNGPNFWDFFPEETPEPEGQEQTETEEEDFWGN